MKALKILLVLILVACTAHAAPTVPPKGFAIMKKDILIPDAGTATLPRLQEKQNLPCVKMWDEGYLVVCHDTDGEARIAFLPRRDRWGRASARAWTYDHTIPSNNVKVLIPLPLKPGHIPLVKGSRYPVTAADDRFFTLQYSFADFSRDVIVAKRAAYLEPPPKPETDPDKIREAHLEKLLEVSKAKQAELQLHLEEAQAKATRLRALVKDLRQSGIDTEKLKVQLTEAQASNRALLYHKPTRQRVQKALLDELTKLTQEQAKLGRQLDKARLEIDPLDKLHKQVNTAELGLQQIKKDAGARQAELIALVALCTGEKLKKEKRALIDLIEKAGRQHADVTKRLKVVDDTKTILTALFDRLDEVRQENQALHDKLQQLKTEYQDLKKRIQALGQDEDGATPAAADDSLKSQSCQPGRMTGSNDGVVFFR